jgi:hypothetical protein
MPGRSYSSGGGKSNPSPAPSAPPASGRSYGSGGNPSRPPASSTRPPGGSFPPSANPNRPPAGSSSGKSYSQGGAAGSTGAKPSRKSYDAGAAAAQRQAESRTTYLKGQEPQKTYSTPTGSAKTIDPRDAQIRQLREDLNYERWRNRDSRMYNFYGGYWSRPWVVYNDPYNSFFWWWLLDQSIEYQAMWAFHHRYAMDQLRYNDLLVKNSALAARVAQLEAQQGLTRNPAYVPPGLPGSDLMITNEYAQAVYNPQPPPVTPGDVVWVIFKFLLFFAFIAFLIWLVFFKRWGTAPV